MSEVSLIYGIKFDKSFACDLINYLVEQSEYKNIIEKYQKKVNTSHYMHKLGVSCEKFDKFSFAEKLIYCNLATVLFNEIVNTTNTSNVIPTSPIVWNPSRNTHINEFYNIFVIGNVIWSTADIDLKKPADPPKKSISMYNMLNVGDNVRNFINVFSKEWKKKFTETDYWWLK